MVDKQQVVIFPWAVKHLLTIAESSIITDTDVTRVKLGQ